MHSPIPGDDLDMSVGEPARDWRTTLDCFSLDDLLRLKGAFEARRVIPGSYQDASGRGCLLYWLTDGEVTTKRQLLAYDFSMVADGLPAARRVVRYWDWATLQPEVAKSELDAAIETRKAAAAAENEAIRRARRKEPAPVR